MVRVNLDQASWLIQMGYQLHGPVNGPNEGSPEYEVLRALFDKLNSQATASVYPTLTPSGSRPYPRPRPIYKASQLPVTNAIPEDCIDPLLLPQVQPSESIETHVNNNSSINVIGDNLTHIISTNSNPSTVHNPIIPSSLGK